MTDTDTIAQKIAKLILKAESSEHDGERDVFLQKAQELQIRYQVDQAKIAKAKRQGEPEQIIEHSFEVGKRGAGVTGRRALAYAVSQHCDIQGFSRTHAGTYAFVGYESDVEFATMLFSALNLHAEAELRKAVKPEWTHGATFRANFMDGYNDRVRSRLAEQKRAAKAAVQEQMEVEASERGEVELSDSVAMVMTERKARVEAHVSAKYQLRTVRSAAARYCGSSRQSGDAAGTRADITPGTGKMGSRKALGR